MRARAQEVIEYGLLLATIALLVLLSAYVFGGLVGQWLAALAQRILSTGT